MARVPWALVTAGFLTSCALLEGEPGEPAVVAMPKATRRSLPTPTPTVRLEEEVLDEPSPTASPEPTVGPAAEASSAAVAGRIVAESDMSGESMLSRIEASTPPNVAAAYRLIEEGRRFWTQGDGDQALGRFERSVAVDPTNAYGFLFLGRLHRERRAYDQALAFAGRAAALAARRDATCEARAYTLQGLVYEEVGRFVDARSAYSKALLRDPGSVDARSGLQRLGGS